MMKFESNDNKTTTNSVFTMQMKMCMCCVILSIGHRFIFSNNLIRSKKQ